MNGRAEQLLNALLSKLSLSIDYWSIPQEWVQLTNIAGDKALLDVVATGIPEGARICQQLLKQYRENNPLRTLKACSL